MDRKNGSVTVSWGGCLMLILIISLTVFLVFHGGELANKILGGC